jgi:Zn-dependent protease/predicted transcriptional regulator
VALVASLLAHELAHSVSARRAGLNVRRITLWLLGGMSELVDQPHDPDEEVRIAAVGPATSVILGCLFGVAVTVVDELGLPPLVGGALSFLATTNVVLGVFNLLPGTPLDGGRVLHGLWWRHTGSPARATRVASTSGRVLGSLMVGFGVMLAMTGRLDGLWLAMIGWFIAGSAAAERTVARTSASLNGVRVGDVMSKPAVVVPQWWTVDALLGPLTEGRLRHRRFPVTDLEGRPVGTLALADVGRCSPAARGTTTLGELATPVPEGHVISSDAPLDSVLRLCPRHEALLVVVDDGRVVGVLTASDLARALEVAALAAPVTR